MDDSIRCRWRRSSAALSPLPTHSFGPDATKFAPLRIMLCTTRHAAPHTLTCFAPLSGCLCLSAHAAVLGKRVRPGGEDGGSKRKKIYVPSSQFPDVDFVALLTGPRGQTLAGLEASTGARLSLRGRGSGSGAGGDSADDADDELHVLVQADSDDAMEAASSKINDLMYNPEAREKEQQSQQLITMSTALQSPLSREPEKANPNTFSLSSALYANDEGFRMMGARGPPGDERYAPARREEEGSKEMEIEQDKGPHTQSQSRAQDNAPAR